MTTDITGAFQTTTGPIHTISAVTQDCVEVRLPPRAKRLTIGSRTAALWIAFDGTEGQPLSDSGSAFTVANNYLSMELPHGLNTVFIATIDDTTTTVVIILE